MCSPPPSGELVKYTFDTGLQGWALDDFADPANLGYLVPDGIPEPTLVFSATEGEPGLGALVVSATFAGH